MKVNFVMSRDLGSKIFSDIFRRFAQDNRLSLAISEEPLPNADVYHYHRPQLEKELVSPSVVTVHHDLEDTDPSVAFELFEPRYRQAKRVICLNTGQAQFLAARGIHNTSVIPHGFDPGLFQKKGPRTHIPGTPVKLGILSRRYGRRVKGEVLLEEVVQSLPRDVAEFYLVGEGRSKDARMLEDYGFACRCFEILPYRLYPEIYKAIDFLLVLSSFEGGPANIPEALATGTPVLTTPVGFAPDLIEEGVSGLFLSKDFTQVQTTILSLKDNNDTMYDRLMMGAHESDVAIPWSTVISKHVEVYDQVLKGRLKSTALTLQKQKNQEMLRLNV